MSIVVLIDQRGSRRGEDLVPALQQHLNERLDRGLERPFERMLGDKLVGILSHSDRLPQLMLTLDEADGDWAVSAGFGKLADPLADTANSARGPAVARAERAAARVDRSLAGVAIEGGDSVAPQLDRACNLLRDILQDRSTRQREVVALRRRSLTGAEIAEQLDISRRAVHKHLTAAKYAFEVEAARLVTYLSDLAHQEATV